MAIQPKWDKYEAAILLDALLSSLNGEISRSNVVKMVSAQLRKRAIARSMSIDDKFRNIAGIQFQMKGMEYLLTNGERGLDKPSKLFQETVDLYRNDRDAYNRLVSESKAQIPDGVSAQYDLTWIQKEEHRRSDSDAVANVEDDVILSPANSNPGTEEGKMGRYSVNPERKIHMPCKLISQLNKLRKQSAESVENTESFASYKKYLHVERQVETELRNLLRKINANQKKCLVLLCGSAGDGKSHLISYLKNADSEGLLDGFEPYNDATESAEPRLTSIETLAKKLSAFNDENCQNDGSEKMILAVNLGTLNNFIDSEEGSSYSKLREYVENNGILSGYMRDSGYKRGNVFQHISFSEYQVFSLKEDGVEASFLEALIGKVFSASRENPFYCAYQECTKCPLCSRCPVCHNYEFLMAPSNQQAVIRRIIDVVMIDKVIVSTRDVLNLIYDIIVHPNFDEKKIRINPSDVKYLMTYLEWTTPTLINECRDVSGLLNAIQQHDMMRERNAQMDSDAIYFHSIEDIADILDDATHDTPYHTLYELTDIAVLGGKKAELKRQIYRFVVRLKEFTAGNNNSREQRLLKEYLQYLYYQNSGNEKKLAKLYDATTKAIMAWDGRFSGDYICIDDTNDSFWILEELHLKAVINKKDRKINGPLQRFSPILKLHYEKSDSDLHKPIELSIDFALFAMIADMREGYRPTVLDKNRHADFVSFVQQAIRFGNKSTRATIIPKKSDGNIKIVFEQSDFGYEFKVMER